MLLFMTEPDNVEDQAFLLDVYERYKRLMYSILKEYLASEQEREDLIQDCMVKLIKKVSTLRGLNECALTAYIALVVKNTAINYLERQGIRSKHYTECDPDEADTVEIAMSPEELLLLSERTEDFYLDFAKLPENDRRLLAGKYILELNDTELGEVFHCKPASIRMKLTRAKRKACALFEKGERFSGKT